MTRLIGLGGFALLLGTALGCVSSDPGATLAEQDALVAVLPPATQLVQFSSGLSYGEQLSFSYTKLQAQSVSGFSFATRLYSLRQDTVRVELRAGTPGTLFLVDRTAGRYQLVSAREITSAGSVTELSVATVSDVDLWAVFSTKAVATTPAYSAATMRLNATPGQPWSADTAALIKTSLVGADNLQRPWSKVVSSQGASVLSPTSLDGLAKLRFEQLQARTGVPPTTFRWAFSGRDYHVIQSASGLSGTLDIYFTSGRWIAGATLVRNALNDDISNGILAWVDP